MSTKIHEDLTENEKLDSTTEQAAKLYTEEEYNKLKEDNLRTYADFENVKKRLIRDKENAIKYANEKFALDLLEVLDTLYIAEEHIKDTQEKEGITNTIKKMESVFDKYGITETIYDVFDPEHHQAIQNVESEKDSGMIVDVHRKGYKYNDKLLRPAMVSVSK